MIAIVPDLKLHRRSAGRRVVFAALAGNVAVALTKLVAAVVTGSAAMFSESVHSVVDCGNEALLLYGYRRAARRPDLIHPLGFGRELYFLCTAVRKPSSGAPAFVPARAA